MEAESHMLLGRAQRKSRDYQNSLKSFEKCLALNANNYAASIQLANLLVELGQDQCASKCYQNAIRVKHDSAAAHFGLILAVLRNPNGSEACAHHLKEVLRHDPDNLTTLTQLALLRFFEYEDVKCIRLLRKAFQISNSFVPALVVMGELERFTGRSDMAQKYY